MSCNRYTLIDRQKQPIMSCNKYKLVAFQIRYATADAVFVTCLQHQSATENECGSLACLQLKFILIIDLNKEIKIECAFYNYNFEMSTLQLSPVVGFSLNDLVLDLPAYNDL